MWTLNEDRDFAADNSDIDLELDIKISVSESTERWCSLL